MGKVVYSHAARSQRGVYAIVNTVTGHMYIGMSEYRFSERWSMHGVELRKNKHGNTHLQRDWNRYGAAAFEFRILEGFGSFDQVPDLYALEKKYIQSATTPLYNVKDNPRFGVGLIDFQI